MKPNVMMSATDEAAYCEYCYIDLGSEIARPVSYSQYPGRGTNLRIGVRRNL